MKECVAYKDQLEEDSEASFNDPVPSPILISGSEVVQGSGKYIILLVGDFSTLGFQEKIQKEKLKQ